MGNQIAVYKCPGDFKPSLNGNRIRSYSMNSQVGAADGSPQYNTGWQQYKKITGCRVSDFVGFMDLLQ